MPYLISGARNQKQLMDPKTARACPKCGRYTHLWEDRGDLKTKIDRDWSGTEEGFQIVSQRFRDIAEHLCTSELDFLSLSNGCYVFRPKRTVFLDLTDVIRALHGPCLACGRFTAVLGFPHRARIMDGQNPVGPFDILRAAQAFGGDQLVFENAIFGDEIMAAMKREKLRGGVYWDSFPQERTIKSTKVEMMPPDDVRQ
jgi:hypothetical protein